MGGKTTKSTSSVQIPQDVLNRYNSVNAQAQQVASTPFQIYSTNPNAFVAPLNSAEQAAISQTSADANEAQPYFTAATSQLENAQAATQPYYSTATGLAQQALAGAQPYQAAATDLAAASAGPVNAQPLDIGAYLSPYLGSVAQSQEALLNEQNQQQMSGELGNIIQSGAFGGDRAGIAAANLEQQQDLANNSILSNILNTGYDTALQTAQQQQGVDLSAAQANRAALGSAASELAAIGQQGYQQDMGASTQQATLAQDIYGTGANTANDLANLGAGAQSAALSGAQAELAAGQVAQSTSQAGLTALYNQFLQQQSYPFQVTQFLANIAEGTGALSGETTTSSQSGGGLFSDERLKEHIRPVGKLTDGQTVYAYNFKGDPRTQIGLLAQEVEKRHPEAVGLAGGFMTVDYGKATKDAGRPKRYAGGLAPAHDPQGYAYGGAPGFDPAAMAALVQAETAMFGPGAGAGGGANAMSRVPAPNLAVGQLKTAEAPLPQPRSLAQNLSDLDAAARTINSAVNSPFGQWAQKQLGLGAAAKAPAPAAAGDDANGSAAAPPDDAMSDDYDLDAFAPSVAEGSLDFSMPSVADGSLDFSMPSFNAGGRIRRYAGGLAGYADGGDVDPYGGGGGGPYGSGPGLSIPDEPPNAKLATAPAPPAGGQSGGGGLNQLLGLGSNLMQAGQGLGLFGGAGADAGAGAAGSALAGLGGDAAAGLGAAGSAAAAGAAGAAGAASAAGAVGAGVSAAGGAMADLLPLLMVALKRGGRVGFASGGVPHDGPTTLDDDSSPTLGLAGGLAGPMGGAAFAGGGLLDVLQSHPLGALLNRGGRIRKDVGGLLSGDSLGPGDDSFAPPDDGGGAGGWSYGPSGGPSGANGSPGAPSNPRWGRPAAPNGAGDGWAASGPPPPPSAAPGGRPGYPDVTLGADGRLTTPDLRSGPVQPPPGWRAPMLPPTPPPDLGDLERSPSVRGAQAPAPAAQSGIGTVPGYPESGSTSWRNENDQVIVRAVNAYNARHNLSPGDDGYMTAERMKSWEMEESGGSANRRAFERDPWQVNNPGDQSTLKTSVTGLSPTQEMDPARSANAALEWYWFRGHPRDASGNPTDWIGDERAFERYNANRSVDANGKLHQSNYANGIISRTNQMQNGGGGR